MTLELTEGLPALGMVLCRSGLDQSGACFTPACFRPLKKGPAASPGLPYRGGGGNSASVSALERRAIWQTASRIHVSTTRSARDAAYMSSARWSRGKGAGRVRL
jgi:hypothetical protein